MSAARPFTGVGLVLTHLLTQCRKGLVPRASAYAGAWPAVAQVSVMFVLGPRAPGRAARLLWVSVSVSVGWMLATAAALQAGGQARSTRSPWSRVQCVVRTLGSAPRCGRAVPAPMGEPPCSPAGQSPPPLAAPRTALRAPPGGCVETRRSGRRILIAET